jgi:tellurite resistance protein TehA-like permease
LVPGDADYRAAHLTSGPAPLVSMIALALIGASALGTLGYCKRWRPAYTWALMLAGLGLSFGAFAYYS